MNIQNILKSQIEKFKLSSQEYVEIDNNAKIIFDKIKSELKKRKIKADIFIGGSLAKQTIMRKDSYDADIFVRFDKKYKDSEISELLGKVVKKLRVRVIHGSRDYFQLKSGKITFEIVPVLKIPSPKQMQNVTDLSYFHVNYIMNQAKKNKALPSEIVLAKSFCYFNGFYGAESYIRGFSGYALELLVSHYGSFLNFLKQVSKEKTPIILDPSKFYKNKNDVMNNLNESKLMSPIILVDPTFKERNALAALGDETFSKFVQVAKKFIKSPSAKYFEAKEIKIENYDMIFKFQTNKQSGDIAGSKLFKFGKYLKQQLEKNFDVQKYEFVYDDKKSGIYYFKIKDKKEILLTGPVASDKDNLKRFKKKHKKVFVKKGRAYVKLKPLTTKKFIAEFTCRNKKIMQAMSIVSAS